MRKYDVRKIAVMTCAAVLAAFSLTACGSRKTDEVTPEEVIEQAESADSAIAAEAEKIETEALQDFVGEMDLEGSWSDEISQRASMYAVKNEDGSYDIFVHWGGGAKETAIWEIHGTYDETSGMLSYEDGAYSIHTWDEDNTETVHDEETTKGAFMKEGDKLRWQDSKNSEDGLFVKVE